MDTAPHPLWSRIVALIALTFLTAAAVWMFPRPDATDSGVPVCQRAPRRPDQHGRVRTGR